MKKILLFTAALTLTGILVGCAANAPKDPPSSSIAESSAGSSSTSTANSSTDSNTNESTTESMPTPARSSNANWAGAYQTVLQQAQEDYPDYQGLCSYSVYDLDHDSTPELFLKTGTCEADFMFHIYSFADTAATEILQIPGGHSSICGLSNQDGFLVLSGQMNYEKIEAYYGKSDSLPEVPEVLFEGEVKEYHDLTCLEAYEIDDDTGLNWTANLKDTNQAVLDSLK